MIYLDFASATFVDPVVKKSMDVFFTKEFGNPNSLHSLGLRSLKALCSARLSVAKNLNCSSEEIIFTGSGTESINLAIKGIFRANKSKGKHIIVSSVEHAAVLGVCKYLEDYEGAEVTYLPVDNFGRVSSKVLSAAIRPDTVLVSIIYGNNEIGTINNLKKLAGICKSKCVLFHSDACQAGLLDVNVKNLGVDLFTLNGSKLYGPKGVGVLFIKKGTLIEPIIHGGGQEFGLRSGTECVPLIVGFAKALELCQKSKKKESARLIKLRDYFIKRLLKIPGTFINGHLVERLPNNVHVSFADIEGESLLLHLDKFGICASTGSACSGYSLMPSHVLSAIGLSKEVSNGSIRFTLGRSTSKKDIDFVLKVLSGIVKKLRLLSPVRIRYD